MPQDVFKILKDLELKAVGLDPQTSKMQEGYFVAFRNIGLPIHPDDFDNPWSPTGVNLEKDIPKTEPVDPKNAPKTGSGQMDENKVFAANIAKSQQSYLNTFLLTDEKLVLSNQYSVMPGSSKVSDSWYAITTGASGIPTTAQPTPELQAALDAEKAKLVDKNGDATPHYIAYKKYENEWRGKVRSWHKAYADAFTNPMKLQSWPDDGAAYEDEANEAMDTWIAMGYKEEIENAINTLAAQGTDPAIALISQSKKQFENSLTEFLNIGKIPYTLMEPNSWYDKDDDDGWNEYSSDDFHSESHYSESSTAYSGAGGFLEFWGGASLNHDEKQTDLNIKTDGLDISFKYSIVDIIRPWLDTSLLNLRNWFLTGDYRANCISDGTMGQHLPGGGLEATFLPSLVTSLILIKGLVDQVVQFPGGPAHVPGNYVDPGSLRLGTVCHWGIVQSSR